MRRQDDPALALTRFVDLQPEAPGLITADAGDAEPEIRQDVVIGEDRLNAGRRKSSCRCNVSHIGQRRLLVLGERGGFHEVVARGDRKSTPLNSSHVAISYAVFCLKKTKVYT